MFRKYEQSASADATSNSYQRDTVGNKEDAAVQTVGTTKSIVAYIKGILTYLLVASADATTNTAAKDVVGNKTDVAVSTVAATKSVVGYLKGIIALLKMIGRQGGSVWFADSTISASGAGQSWATAFKTITEAVAAASAGDTIMIRGSFTEAVTCSLAGVRFIGAGTCPKEAQWTAAADAKCLTLSAAYCLVENIYFSVPAYTAGTPAAIVLGAAPWTIIRKCRFQGKATSRDCIYSATAGVNDNTHIEDCEFYYLNTLTYGRAIRGVDSGGSAYSGWQILRNVFHSCVTVIDLPARCCVIADNILMVAGNKADSTLGTVMTLGIGLDGTGSGCNQVTRNVLGGTYNATLYKVGDATGAADNWAGNYSADMTTTGTTCVNPA
jgi:hypothetical protein